MNWKIEFSNGKWFVADAEGKAVSEGHDSSGGAFTEMKTLIDEAMTALAAEETIDPSVAGARFRMTFLEGEQTIDKRVLDPNSIDFQRPPPLPMLLMTESAHGGMPGGARLAGVIDTTRRDGLTIILEGNFDSGSEAGQEAERLVRDGVLTTWSPDVGNASIELEVTEEDEEGFPVDYVEHLTEGTVVGGTMCPIQAITSAKIEIVGQGTAETETEEPVEKVAVAETVAASGAPVKPPTAWFEEPEMTGPTPLTVTPEGQVYGLIAQFGVCHTGMQDRCVLAPKSQADYAYFLTGTLETAEGEDVRVGQLTMGTGHADLTLRHSAAKAHYDGGPGAIQAADVVVGENAFGIWCAGALRPGLTDEQVREFKALAISGDWRNIAGNMELVAALSVPVPGFPVTIAASGATWTGPVKTRLRMEHGDCTALVAAGMVRGPNRIDGASRFDLLESRIAVLETENREMRAETRALRSQAADALLASVVAE